jgi:phosphoadenosine phosphosulfate reductase
MSRAIERNARAMPGFEGRVAHAAAVLQSAAAEHTGAIVQTTSLGAEDMVVTDLIARHGLPIALATLDTGWLHEPTLALIPRLESRYGLHVERWQPPAEEALAFVRQHGEMAMRRSVALRQACCALRKLEPLARALAGRRAWVTGLRREQSGTRAEVPFRDIDDTGRHKFNPLADWSWHDVWHYIDLHQVPFNPLHDEHFPSIGCEPCTRAVAQGEDLRAGRWWWESEDAKECGLHGPHAVAASAAGASRSEAQGGFASVQAHVGAADVSRSQSLDSRECGLHPGAHHDKEIPA